MNLYVFASVKLTHDVVHCEYVLAYALDVQFFMKQPEVCPK